MKPLGEFEAWLITGSQELYGEATLREVQEHARQVGAALDASPLIPVRVVPKPVVTDPDGIARLLAEADDAPSCIGVIAWMHTFSPARMWIGGLLRLRKPLLHLHTQFNRALPWAEIDMDFMNLNQAAHGDREFAHLLARLRRRRAMAVGHWEEPRVAERIGNWARAACGWNESQHLKVARFGDNMRQVAVTEGDKVEAQVRLGVAVNGYGVSDLAAAVAAAPAPAVEETIRAYESDYELDAALAPGGPRRSALIDAARIEVGLRHLLREGGFGAFTDTFEDLDGLVQLPGIAVQRLMADGYGFGAEGDWKTAVLVRLIKVMSRGLPGGTSFMEDYTYHLGPGEPKVLGAHMLEVCPSIADGRPRVEIHPLAIGGKADPVRLVFTARPGPAVVASLVDLGDRFRLVANAVDIVPPDEPLPRLPVARAVWRPHPDLATATEAWLLAGGAHHTCLSQAISMEALEDFAEIAGIEFLAIDDGTQLREFRKEVRWNEAYYRLAPGG
jgi:L-arabinose isomerase